MTSNIPEFEMSPFFIGFNSLHGHVLSLSVNNRSINGKSKYSAEITNKEQNTKHYFIENTLSKLEDTIAENVKYLLHDVFAKQLESILSNSIKICESRKDYIRGMAEEKSSIDQRIKTLLSLTKAPESISSEITLEKRTRELLILELFLPDFSIIPEYLVTKTVSGKLKFRKQTQSELSKYHKSIIYQLILRAIYFTFAASKDDEISTIVVNGIVSAIDNATGKEKNQYITSLSISRSAFENIDLQKVDPEACFKSLRGIEIPRFNHPTSIAPIMQISREDARFVESESVIDNINESTNLASLPWEEFEHLIREIFECEFKTNGGEVKVTQASRDGGVDAIAFDPDPIRGGKIVIQAKRYTNTVGVSAVRDLYGTVLNEGATKGIVTVQASCQCRGALL